MRHHSLALFASVACLAALTVSLPAAAEEAAKPDDKAPSATAPAKTDATTPPAGEKPTSKSIEANNNEFLGKGSLIIGAERVFGFAQTSTKTDGISSKSTQWGILWGAPTSVYQIPRMAVDYVAFDQVTFGGALGIAHSSFDGGTSSTNLLIAPRAGYIFGGKGVLSLWARAGFTFFSTSNGSGAGGAWGTAFNIEPEIIISPYKHLGIYLGAVVDLGLFGKETVSTSAGDTKLSSTVTNYGVTSGLRAWF